MPPPQEEQQQQPHRPQGGRRPRPPPAPPPMAYSDDMVVFYDAWVDREEQIVADLTAALALPPRRHRDALAALVGAAVDHVATYYEHKARLADRDVVAALDPRWLNPLERTFLWAWGWKPALVFRFVESGGSGGIGPAQRRALEDLHAATAAAERGLDREVAAVQESLAGPRVLAALRRQAPRNGEEADDAVAAVGRALRVLLRAADALRERTLRGVVGLLSPDQAGAFLAAMLRFHLGVRRAGRDWSPGHGGYWGA
ncbi:transcription factor TGA5-like [Panicum miliaceum]|uniref:Transcription factor TGA5-like n=1 Tax=Panicum miliaceum TaxID=4540 RepID=A0A3L6SSH8_PANMI|nr:transcription factor TGA5-like [Panicum miliaceum]